MFDAIAIKETTTRLKSNQKLCPDGIPVEIVKEMIEPQPSKLLQYMNQVLCNSKFQEIWKKITLVLI